MLMALIRNQQTNLLQFDFYTSDHSDSMATRAQEDWVDVTEDIQSLSKKLKLLQTVNHKNFNLEDGMHSHEINDNKIDPKATISSDDNIAALLLKNLIKLPSALTLEELIAVYAETLKQQTLILIGYPLPQTIYTLTYIFDPKIYQESPEISALINSIHGIGSYIYELHKESCSIKEDDLGFSTFSFSTKFKSHDEISKEFQAMETTFSNRAKEESEKSHLHHQMAAILRIRKSFHTLAKAMSRYFDAKMQTKIEKELGTVQKNIDVFRETLNGDDPCSNSEKILSQTGIFNKNVAKTLRSHFGPRVQKDITLEESLKVLENCLRQLELFIPIPNRVSLLKDRIQQLHEMPLNLWSKSYIKNNMYHTEEMIFNTLKTHDLILNDINEYIGVKEGWKNEEKFTMLTKATMPVYSEILFRYLGRNSRSFWEVSRCYEDFNILIHMSNEFDISLFPPNKKELHVSAWYYNTGLNVLIKQLLAGIETNLYQHYEYPYVFYLLESFLGVFDRNAQVFLKKFDKPYQNSFIEGTLTHKKKKKVPEVSRKYFSDAVFKKALHYYIRSLHRVLFVMVCRGHLVNPFEQNLELVIKNRFRVFKNVYFVRTITYEQYKSDFEVISKDQTGYLQEAMQLLKEAKNQFQSLQHLEDSDCFTGVREDSRYLAKACVKCSLVVMSLKMNQKEKKYQIENNHPKYPEVSIG